jgi:N-acetylglucosaminyl-diphospho-decaprenol L-rhamnosyltransferase
MTTAPAMRAAMLPAMLVVIVNYRTAALVIACLESLSHEAAVHPQVRVEVVDNASPDGSGRTIADTIAARGWSRWAMLRPGPVNGGFAYGNNLAIRAWLERTAGQTGQLAWLLNPDTIVRPGACAAIFEFFGRHPRVGVIGTAIDDDHGTRWPFAFRFHTLWSELDSALRIGWLSRRLRHRTIMHRMDDVARPVDWVSGASTVFRREVFDTVGLLDEQYFLYFEETDYFRAVARAGWPCWYVPQAQVVHFAGQSTGLTSRDASQRRIPDYWFAARRRYFVKNHGRAYAIVVDGIAILGLALWRVRCRLKRRPHGGSPHLLRDLIRQSALFRSDIHANAQIPAPPHSIRRVPVDA